jgi:hypothetical protein
MPWNAKAAKGFSKKAGKSKVASRQWAHIADSVLKKTGNEGLAIRTASGVVKKRGRRK